MIASKPQLPSSIPTQLHPLIIVDHDFASEEEENKTTTLDNEKNKSNGATNHKVRIVVMSDTHQFYSRHIENMGKALENSPLDNRILLHCGDFGFYGQEKAALNFNLDFLPKIKHLFKYIVVIIGNHSSPLMESMDFNVDAFKDRYLSNATHLLFDSSVKLCGLTIHGISWKSKKEDTFPFTKFPHSQHPMLIQKLKIEKYLLIPPEVNIILNHEPPQDILDDGSGSEAFRHFLNEKVLNSSSPTTNYFPKLKLVAFGHAHSKYGHQSIEIGSTSSSSSGDDGIGDHSSIQFINAALNNMNSPYYFDMQIIGNQKEQVEE